ncbi:hypothetical protein PN441_12315 [Spirulina major CS-329]|uniref:hypothetical protein n=1 Tax=Spirulina TaxID=1154 RepID=UPI00232D8D76|nr:MULTISPECIES: hypothetical protein [Spirulina]MDB9493544.1 hypothetical protein [Spirulina subsalsa CS-330]MDB9503856.1 hypothetical protein [Spirulina major CS-329]
MVFQLEEIVPWGRSSADYHAMFNLTDADLAGVILDCAGGPASFNAEMTEQGHHIISCDPIYHYSPAQLEQRIEAVYPIIVQGMEQARERFNWRPGETPERLGDRRLLAMQTFLADLIPGKAAQRYQVAELPSLPFADQQFTLALSSHLLFTYSEQLSLAFHQAALVELARVAAEVRIFPIVENFTGERSRHFNAVYDSLTTQGYRLHLCPVSYHFQKGGNEMLIIQPPT